MADTGSPYLTKTNTTAKEVKWLREIRATARVRDNIRLSKTHAALLVVDMQNAFCDPKGSAWLSSSPAVLANVTRLMEHFTSMHRPVILTHHCHTGDPGLFGTFYRSHISCGSFDATLYETLPRHLARSIITKETYDAFHETALEEILRDHGCAHLVVCGLLTHLCVESTARAAFSRGIVPFVPVAATCDRSEALHLHSLISMSDACVIPISMAEVLG